jgi:hypothetical protein
VAQLTSLAFFIRFNAHIRLSNCFATDLNLANIVSSLVQIVSKHVNSGWNSFLNISLWNVAFIEVTSGTLSRGLPQVLILEPFSLSLIPLVLSFPQFNKARLMLLPECWVHGRGIRPLTRILNER